MYEVLKMSWCNLTDTAMKENLGVMLPLKHDTSEFVGCLEPRFVYFFRVIVVATRERGKDRMKGYVTYFDIKYSDCISAEG